MSQPRPPLFLQATVVLAVGAIVGGAQAHAETPAHRFERADQPQTIEAVTIHPVFNTLFVSMEHHDGQLGSLGDALGRDCIVVELVEKDGRKWSRMYRGDGHRNEDWYGWGKDVLAPFDGEVVKVNENPKGNTPGAYEKSIASFVIVKRDDKTHVLVAHIQDIVVRPGARVKAGQKLGVVGNNGNSWHPHIHIGAWREQTPLQIQFDLKAMARLLGAAR